MESTDVAIIGGGIVGLATAYKLLDRAPGTRVVVLEKEASLAFHQTGRNSGVLHSGIYYKPGSLRAKNCVTGKDAMVRFCQEEGVGYDICGKVIVAVDESELPALDRIVERGRANGVACEIIDRARLLEIEPHAAGIKAIYVPGTGIVDYPGVCQKLAQRINERGGRIMLSARVTAIRDESSGVAVATTAGEFYARQLVNCGGLHADRLATLGGHKSAVQIVPFRGEYYELKPEAKHLCRHLIYPVPDPKFPFLGVHFTRLIGGGVECGPNAVLAFAREGYRMRDVNFRDLWESLTFPGFLRLAGRNWRMGLGEMWRSLSKAAFVRALQRLMPEIRAEQLESAPSGVRAQALTREGNLADDFLIESSDRIVNVLNAPSPAATSALNIGEMIVERITAEK